MDPLCIHIVRRLYRHKMFKDTYKPIEWVLKGSKKDIRLFGSSKSSKDAIKYLRKHGLIQLHKNNKCISLNSTKNTKPIIEKIATGPAREVLGMEL
jgi:hypothetical protein